MTNLFNISMLKGNWKSGLTVALISIPLSISLAVASGVSPVWGIITAIWAGYIGALFGGSNYNIIGPTGALSGFIASYAFLYGAQSIPLLAILSGIFILLAYVFKLEKYFIFVPSGVIHGFTLGIACIIGLNQLNYALGLKDIPKHEKFFANIIESMKHLNQSSLSACLVFASFFLALLLLKKTISWIPGVIILSPIGIAIGYLTKVGILPFSVETLGDKFGTIKFSLMQKGPLPFGKHLLLPGLIIAFIAIIETMLSAKIADGMTKTRHNRRKEVLGLGLANIISGFLGGIPATAALARTSLNIKSGATSSLSALLSSIFIMLGSILFLSYFAYIPMSAIAAILAYVAVNMIEREHFIRLFKHDKANFVIAMFVAFITIYEDPIIGVLTGTVMALLLLVNRLSKTVYETKVEQKENDNNARKKNILIFSFKGKLVYINSQAYIMRFQSDFIDYSGIILVLNELHFIDLDGVDALEEIIELIQSRGQTVMVVVAQPFVKRMIETNKKFKELESKNLVFESLSDAL